MQILLSFKQTTRLIFLLTASWCSRFIEGTRARTIVPNGQKNKLIARAYDGAAEMRGAPPECSVRYWMSTTMHTTSIITFIY